MKKINVAILGATGMVGQRLVERLVNHPWFEIRALMANKDLVGKFYKVVCNWIVSREMPEKVRERIIKESSPDFLKNEDIEIVFSAIPTETAKELEPKFAKAGYKVFSTAPAFRMEKDIPLLIAEVNPEQFNLLEKQRVIRGWEEGFIITTPNCVNIILVLVLKPLLDAFGIKKLIVSTLQAASGVGYPGLPSLDIIDNILPYIKESEEILQTEPLKILGANFGISFSCHRVPTSDGHLEDLHISLEKPVSVEEVKEVLANFGSSFKKLPSSPEKLIIVREKFNRPQPKLDRLSGNGMTITVGKVRKDPVLENGIKMNILGHNTIRGAAGQIILNAEFWVTHYRKN